MSDEGMMNVWIFVTVDFLAQAHAQEEHKRKHKHGIKPQVFILFPRMRPLRNADLNKRLAICAYYDSVSKIS